jgi:ribonuclease I
MHVTYDLSIHAQCPVDDAQDHYAVTVEAHRAVRVETILAVVADLPPRLFQEDITQWLAAALGCRVTTVGYHSGVKTTCTA